MSVTAEEIQAELDAIRENAEERAQLELAAKQRSEFLDDPANEFGRGITVGIANSAGIPVDVANALMNAVGIQSDAPLGSSDSIYDVLNELGMQAPEGIPLEPTTVLEGAGEGIGAAAVITPAMLAPFMEMAMDPQFEARQAAETRAFLGGPEGDPTRIPRGKAARAAFLMKQLGQRIARTAVENPKTFIAAETAAAGAAGAAMEKVEQMGGSPSAQMTAGLGAGTIASVSPTAWPRIVRNAARWGMKHFNPFRASGAEPRAAEQIQMRASNAEEAAEAGLAAPEGVTPARASGQDQLMAQEARVLADDPELDRMVREDLEAAIMRAENDLRSLYGTPRGKENWELAVFQRVAPEGVVVKPGTSEEMLDQLYKSFKPLYQQFKGYPIRPQMFTTSRKTPLETMIKNVPETNRVQVSEQVRQAVNRRLNAMWQGFSRRIKPNKDGLALVDSGDLLKFRSDIRDEARRASKRGDLESVDLYRIAEEKVNAVLRSQLQPDLLSELKTVDSMYRNYKVTEDAVYRGAGTDKGLSPEGLLQSLRASASSKGGYARGEQLELRSLAASGRPIAKVLNDPPAIRRAVNGMSAEDLQDMQREAFETLLSKATRTNDVGEDYISGARLKQMMNNMGDSFVALQMDEASLGRMNEIADQMIMMQRKSPEAVTQLYEDGPADILQLLATLVGAKHGQNVAGRGMGSSLVLAGWFARKARKMLENLTTNQARRLLADAVTDKELFARLLTTPTHEKVFQEEAAQYLKAYLAQVAQRGAREVKEEQGPTPEEAYRRELERLQREAQRLGPNF